jgi:non-lysosomal glucosylceramidase
MPSIDRREFSKVVGLAATSTLIPTMADGIETPGTSPAPDWETLVPADKHLDPAWIASITERGSPTVYSRPDLKFVGMPVGGLFAGQLYLGGDGKLWLWDIFNGLHNTAGEHYAHPQEAFSPVDQGFILRVGDKNFPLDATSFSDITFRGEYPIGLVTYKDPACPVTVTMEAFSPFCPLDADFSSLPATVMRITIRNHSPGSVDLELLARLQNAVCQNSLPLLGGILKSKNVLHRGLIEFSAEADQSKSDRPVNAPTIFTDFEGETFDPWVADGHAFGKGPTAGAPDPAQHLSGFSGRKLANSWATRSDTPTGKLTSPAFVISRPYINFLIGGGNHPGQTCINLLVDGKRVLTTTGKNSDVMEWASFPVSRWMNKKATLEIIDDHSGDWGHIEIDQIEFADEPRGVRGDLRDQPDFGTMCLALLDQDGDWGFRDQPDADPSCGAIYTQVSLEPQAEKTISFAITWHFPNLNFAVTRWDPLHKIVPSDVIEKGRHYATRFDSAQAVAEFVSDHHEDFYRQTKLWRDTWYDSTLPYWFLDRTIANISTLATTTSYRFADGRYWGYEGVGSCRGTCTHVYGYEQSVGRLFPELDILLRERTDFGVGFNDKTGAIGMRGERSAPAVDGTCMILLRTLRDHQMSADDSFLKTYWPKIKQAMTWLIAQDHNRDGILLGAQANTLDAEWYGAVPWISGLYLAAMAAGAELAGVAGDTEFAGECQTLLEAGQKNFAAKMFNGEYFVQIADKKHLKAVGSFDGCEIDQVLGQRWDWAGFCRRNKRGRLWRPCGNTTSPKMSVRFERHTNPVDGSPCPVKPARSCAAGPAVNSIASAPVSITTSTNA